MKNLEMHNFSCLAACLILLHKFEGEIEEIRNQI